MDFNKMIPSTRSHQLQVAGALQDFINNIDISTTKWAQQLLHFEKCFEVNFLQVIGEMDVDGRVNETATQLYNLYQRYNRTTARRGSSSKEQHNQRQFYFRALSFEEAVQFGMYAKYIKTTLNNKFHEDYFEGITPSEGDSSHAHPYNTTTHRFSSEIPRPVSPENELLDKDLQEVIHHFRDKPRPSAAGGHRRVQSPLPTTATSSIINNLSNTTEREETTTGPELPMRRPLRPASAGKPGGKQARRRPTLTYSDVTEPHADAAPVVLENRNDNTEQHTLPHTEDGLILSAFNELAKESNVEGKKTVKIAEVLFLLKKNFDIVANLTPLHGIEIDKSFKGK
ncbi:hypothetical protein AGDE_14236 [Angomonas deanei]|nr:hypothetical protein AGDE_14236 [Angomonas deanei]|eukprot:EPY21140.1 hypothetical protein AGDE_14236 [Angomonas deanei]